MECDHRQGGVSTSQHRIAASRNGAQSCLAGMLRLLYTSAVQKPELRLVNVNATQAQSTILPTPGKAKDGYLDVPPASAFSHFLKNLIAANKKHDFISIMMADLRQELMKELPDFGQHQGYPKSSPHSKPPDATGKLAWARCCANGRINIAQRSCCLQKSRNKLRARPKRWPRSLLFHLLRFSKPRSALICTTMLRICGLCNCCWGMQIFLLRRFTPM